MKKVNFKVDESLLTTIALIVGAMLVFGSIIYTSILYEPNPQKFAEVKNEIITPTPTIKASPPVVKPKPPQKLSVPIPANASSGPPITLYTKTDVNIYKSASNTSEIIGQAQQYGYWEFPYTPTGDWYSVLTLENKPGFVKATDLTPEKPTSPAHCSLKYTYNLTRIDGFWRQKGYDEEKLLGFIKYAEKQWEDASSKDLFQYDPSGDNKIDFIVDDYQKVNPAGDEYGLYVGKSYVNGTTAEKYNIIMFSGIFEYSQRSSTTNYGGVMTDEQMDDYIIVAVIIHELGHAIGMSHLEQESAIMHKSANFPSTEPPKLTDFDKDALRNWCSGN